MRKITLITMSMMLAGSVFAQQSVNQPPQIHQRGEAIQATKGHSRAMATAIISTNNYIAGTTMDLNFILNLTSPDLEYGDSLWMQFPAGFVLNSASNPFAVSTEGQGDEVLNLPIVSPAVSWGDNDNNWGGIELGAHSFFVNVTIPAGTTGPISVAWYLSGDEFGAAPNFNQGTTTILPLPSVPDMETFGASNNPYYSIPIGLPRDIVVGAQVSNNGADLTTAADLTINAPSIPFSSNEPLTIPHPTGASQIASATIPASSFTLGMHDVFLDVNNANDFDPANNKDTVSFIVSDSVYAFTDTITGGTSLGIGDGSDGVIGSIFEIPVTKSISSISFYSPTPDPTSSVSFVIFETDATGPTTLIFESDTFAVTGSGGTMYNRPVNMSLAAGSSYLIGVREQSTGSMRVGTTTMGYFPDTHYAYFSGSWLEIGSVGFAFGLSINANFSESCNSDFTFAVDGVDPMKVQFTDASTIPTGVTLAYDWNFGDGNTDNSSSPAHTYATEGKFNVCLSITDGGSCSSTKCDSVTIDDGINGIESIPVNSLKVYPNPSTGIVTLDYDKPAVVTVYSIEGSKVYEKETIGGLTKIDLLELPTGTYLMRIQSDEGVSTKRISLMK